MSRDHERCHSSRPGVELIVGECYRRAGDKDNERCLSALQTTPLTTRFNYAHQRVIGSITKVIHDTLKHVERVQIDKPFQT